MNLVNNIKKISKILDTVFGIRPTEVTPLNGYANINYLVKSGGKKFVFKQYTPDPGLAERLEAESEILDLLAHDIPNRFQLPVKTRSGKYLLSIEDELGKNLYRLLTYVPGNLLADTPHTKALFLSFGLLLGKMDKSLQNIRKLSLEAYKHSWDLLHIDQSKKYFDLIKDADDRKMVKHFHLKYHDMVLPYVPDLRKSIIHADANDLNVLTKNDAVTGIIDFGDMTYSLLINELAVALTYAMFGKTDPLSWAVPVIEGYSQMLSLEEREIDLLYYLIGARLCISISMAAKATKDNPNDPYLTVSKEPARQLLKQWVTINPIKARDTFRKAAGLKTLINDTSKEDIKKRTELLSKTLSISYDKPIKMTGAAFQFMYDKLGNTYLDTRNNIPHVGHNHPVVVEAGQRQMARLNTNTRYLYDELIEFSEKLLNKFPPSLNKVFFVNSGSAASDLAIRLALAHTKKQGIAVMENGYHGNTGLAIDVSHYKFAGKGGTGPQNHISVAPAPDTYRGPFQNSQTAGVLYANAFIKTIEDRKGTFAAFIAEPIISAAGQIPLPKGYLDEIYPFIRSQGGVCISDEVQTGFGRLGTHFWGFEQLGAIPDIVMLGKPIGNGHPMAAVVCTDVIAKSFENGMEFFSSFGGNPVSCAIGMAVLDVMQDEKLMDNARKVGDHLILGFHRISKQNGIIGDVRGSGLSLGIDIVENKKSKAPGTAIAHDLVEKLKSTGILAGTDGPADNVLKIKPPLCFTIEDANRLLYEIDRFRPE